MKINFVWFFLDNGNVDSYIVEIDFLDWEGDIYQEWNFIKVYQGLCIKYMVRGLDYNVMVFVCVKVLNIVGESELSDEVLLLMEKGI